MPPLPACLPRLRWFACFLREAPFRPRPPKSNKLTDKELAEGWISLFDGETLFGWKAASKTDWQVVDGAIVATSGEVGLLHTTSQFANYVLKVDFRASKGCNSGVFLRTEAAPAEKSGKFYEVNIADAANPWPTGSLVYHKKYDAAPESTDWQTFELTANGDQLAVVLNGKTAVEVKDPKPLLRGFIGLQFRQGKIEFRNVRLKPLATKSLFNGKDLTGWKQPEGSKSVCTVTPEGWLNLKNGKGDLETAGQYADFTLQLEAFVNGKGLNSGVFYRCIPGEMMNGYECQIHNSFKDGDRNKPQDCGSGGIYRRVDARRVMADDFQWFPMTLHADGPHVAVWVNGYQVTDWTDTRKPHDNPRSGLRLKAGSIQIQGHDPTTDFSFRNLRIAELPEGP